MLVYSWRATGLYVRWAVCVQGQLVPTVLSQLLWLLGRCQWSGTLTGRYAYWCHLAAPRHLSDLFWAHGTCQDLFWAHCTVWTYSRPIALLGLILGPWHLSDIFLAHGICQTCSGPTDLSRQHQSIIFGAHSTGSDQTCSGWQNLLVSGQVATECCPPSSKPTLWKGSVEVVPHSQHIMWWW